jgi:hypothetical protein
MRNSIGTASTTGNSVIHASPRHHEANAVMVSGIAGGSFPRTRRRRSAYHSRSDRLASKSIWTA